MLFNKVSSGFRIVILIFVFVGAVLITAGVYYYNYQQNALKTSAYQELNAVASMKIDQITKWRNERISESRVLCCNVTFSRLVKNITSSGKNPLYYSELNSWLQLLKKHFDFEDIFLTDRNGNQIIKAGDGDICSEYLPGFFSGDSNQSSVAFSDLHFNNEGLLHLDMIAPVYDLSEERDRNQITGFIFFQINPRPTLFSLVESNPVSGKTFETLIVRRENDSIQFLNELRYVNNSVLKFNLPIKGNEKMISAKAVCGFQGQTSGFDYRGETVLAVVKKIPGTSWVLISKIDSDEVYSGSKTRGLLIMFVTAISLFSAGMWLLLIWNKSKLATLNRLVKAETDQKALLKHFEYLTKYANDIILLSDDNNLIIEVNEKALGSYGYSRDEIDNMNLDALFTECDRVNEQYNDNSLSKGVLYESCHKRKDGSVFPVEISSRMVVIDEKKYVQHIIRDITERISGENRVKHLNAVLKAVRNVNQLITSERNKDRLLSQACQKLIETRGYVNSYIILNDGPNIIDFASASIDTDSGAMVCQLTDRLLPDCLLQADKTEKAVIIHHSLLSCPDCPIARKNDNSRGMIKKLYYLGNDYGYLMVTIPDGFSVDEEEMNLFSELAKDFSFALYSIELDEQKNLALRRLEENERKVTTLMNNLPGLAYRCQADEFFTMELVSRGCFELTGYKPEQIIGNKDISYIDIIHTQDRARVKSEVSKAVSGREAFGLSYRIVTSSGQVKWVWEQGCGIYDDNGATIAIEGFITDITEQKSIEEELRESEQKFREMADLLPQTVFEIDLNGRFTFVNKNGYEFTGYTPEDLANGKTTLDMFIPGDRPRLVENIARLLKGEKVVGNEYIGLKKDGSTYPLITYSTPIIKNGRPAGLRGFVIDITGLKDVENKLRESEQKFRELADLLPQTVFETDLQGCFTFVNRYGFEQFGYRPEDLGCGLKTIDMPAPEDRQRGFINMMRVLSGEINSVGIEYTARKKDGSTIPVLVYSSCIVKNGNPVGIRGTIIDISGLKQAAGEIKNLNIELEERVKTRTSQLESTMLDLKREIDERQKTEEELRLAKEELSNALDKEKDLNELKTRFISMVSHEYRTPLTVILSSVELLPIFYRKQNEPEFDKSLVRIKSSIKSMVDLLENVLTLGRVESGKTVFTPSKFNIIDYCNELVEEIRVIDGDRHPVRFSHDIGDQVIFSDKNILHEILSNLLSNAVKYSPIGSDVLFRVESSDSGLVFNVTDYGIGVSPEDQKHLFDPFFRGKNIGKISGTGLGLSIVKKSVDLLNANITVSSQPGEGTTFTFSLPLNEFAMSEITE